jgi:uncharacterized protein YndB with AHSA1/START domain
MKQGEAYTEAQMMIRKPVAEVFQAFIDPEITKNFWFTHGTGKLEENKEIIWTWEMYGASTKVGVKEIVSNERIVFDWNTPTRTVEFTFKVLQDGNTYVIAKEYGYVEEGDVLIAVIKDSTGGFTTVLDGLKAYLEHGINLNLIGDKYPKEVIE